MRLRSSPLAFLLVLGLAAMPAAANNKKSQRRWVSTKTPPPVQRVLVAGVVEDYVARQQFEDEMKTQLAKYGVEGVQSYIVAPPKNEMMDRELKQRLDESSFDSVLVVRPVPKNSQQSDRHSIYLPPSSYNSFWPYWNKAYGDSEPANSYNKQDAPVRLEFNLYNTKTEKLVWSGETGVLSAKDLDGLNKNYARTIVNFLKKDKIVRK